MATDARAFPRPGIPLALPRPRFASEWLSTRDSNHCPAPPTGNGRPVMLIPGFLAGDTSLTRMALWLRSGGFTPRAQRNPVEHCLHGADRCRATAAPGTGRRPGRPAGAAGRPEPRGSIARALAVLAPDHVDTLITLGSPLLDQLAVRLQVWPSILTVGVLGTIGVPGMFSLSCFRGECCARTLDAVAAPFPEHIRFISVYSRSDEVVCWETCLDPAAQRLEVDCSHVGMGMAREVWVALSAALTAPSA